jgi:hypothetical protein
MTISLSGRQIKSMDRVGGADLIMPWPANLPRGPKLALDEERDATAAEHAVAERMVGEACRAADLVPVRTMVAMLRRPTYADFPRAGAIEQHLIVRIIGHRWVHAGGRPESGECWVRE